MRKILYVILIVLSFLVPVKRLDIAKLLPVEAMAIYKQDGMVVLKTDTDHIGIGKNISEAIENLRENAVEMIYLDTADYLLVDQDAQEEAVELRQYLRPSIQLGIYAGGNVKQEAKYLDTHQNAAKPTD